jgi:hypothetical protein
VRLKDGNSKLPRRSLRVSCTLANCGVVELTEDTVRQAQLGLQQAIEPLEEGEVAEAEHIDAGSIGYDIVV